MSRRFKFLPGDLVRIKVGPFQNFTGKVTEIDEPRGILKVRVEIFGRPQPIELTVLQVEKVDSH